MAVKIHFFTKYQVGKIMAPGKSTVIGYKYEHVHKCEQHFTQSAKSNQ